MLWPRSANEEPRGPRKPVLGPEQRRALLASLLLHGLVLAAAVWGLHPAQISGNDELLVELLPAPPSAPAQALPAKSAPVEVYPAPQPKPRPAPTPQPQPVAPNPSPPKTLPSPKPANPFSPRATPAQPLQAASPAKPTPAPQAQTPKASSRPGPAQAPRPAQTAQPTPAPSAPAPPQRTPPALAPLSKPAPTLLPETREPSGVNIIPPPTPMLQEPSPPSGETAPPTPGGPVVQGGSPQEPPALQPLSGEIRPASPRPSPTPPPSSAPEAPAQAAEARSPATPPAGAGPVASPSPTGSSAAQAAPPGPSAVAPTPQTGGKAGPAPQDGGANAKLGNGGAPSCAILVDTRSASAPMSRGMSPAIVDPSGRAVWPDPKAIQGVSSELVNDTSIALFFGDPSEVPTSSYSKVFRVQAVGTRPPANAPHSSFNDWAVVSPADAERIRGVGLSCQMIFLTAR